MFTSIFVVLSGAAAAHSETVDPRGVRLPAIEVPADLDLEELGPLDQRQIRQITKLSTQLLDLDAAELDDEATTRRGTEEEEGFVLAIVLRAGRPIPPGLSAARRAQRETRAAEALAWLERELETDAGRELVERMLGVALDPGDVGTGSIPELEVAAANVVASLELVEYAPAVARLLGERSLPEVRRGARAALYTLYARTFPTREDFDVRWDDLRGRSPAGTGRDELKAAIDLANERALELLELAPQRLGTAPLDWPQPDMSARAARSLGRAVAGGTLAPATARAFLVDGITEVDDPTELHARLGVLIDLVQGGDPASEPAREVRDVVVRVAETSIEGGPDTVWTAVSALPRLQYEEGAAGDLERIRTLHVGIDVFRIALGKRQMRPVDPDAVQAAIGALRDVARSVGDRPEARADLQRLSRDLRDLVAETGTAPGVARAAASSLTLSRTAEDALGLVELVESEDLPKELAYELLGALKVVVGGAPGHEPSLIAGGDASEDVVQRLFEIASESDFDLRQRALELLLSSELRAAVLAKERAFRARDVLSRVDVEDSTELRVQYLRLLGLIGDADILRLVLESPTLIKDLASSGPEVARAVGETLVQLGAEEDLHQLVEAAQRIAGPLGDASGALDPDRTERLRIAIDLVLGVDAERASSLSPFADRWVLKAAIDLRRAYPVLAPAQLDAASRARLLDVHANELAVPSEGEWDPTIVALTRGLIGSEVVVLNLQAARGSAEPETDEQRAERERAIEEVVAAYQAAIDEPETAAQLGWTSVELGLECVEFLRAVGRDAAALGRLEALFEADAFGPDAPPRRAVRMFAELVLESVDATAIGADRQRVLRASDATLGLVTREDWESEGAARRLADLTALATLVQRADDPIVSAPLVAFLEEQLAGENEVTVERRSDFASVDAEGFGRLMEALTDIRTPAPEEGTPEGDGGDPPAGDGGGSSGSAP